MHINVNRLLQLLLGGRRGNVQEDNWRGRRVVGACRTQLARLVDF